MVGCVFSIVVWCSVLWYLDLMLCVVGCFCVLLCFFFFKQKTAYEMRISDWSSDVVLFRSQLLFVEHGRLPDESVRRWQDRLTPAWKCIGGGRSEERRVGKDVSVRVDIGGRRIIKKKKTTYSIYA